MSCKKQVAGYYQDSRTYSQWKFNQTDSHTDIGNTLKYDIDRDFLTAENCLEGHSRAIIMLLWWDDGDRGKCWEMWMRLWYSVWKQRDDNDWSRAVRESSGELVSKECDQFTVPGSQSQPWTGPGNSWRGTWWGRRSLSCSCGKSIRKLCLVFTRR